MHYVLGGFFMWYTKFQCLLLSLIQEFSWWVTPCNIFCQQQEDCELYLSLCTSELISFQTLVIFPSIFPYRNWKFHSFKLWNSPLCAQLIASTAAIKAYKAEKIRFLHIFNFAFLVILGKICMILKFIFQILVANSKVNFKHAKFTNFQLSCLHKGGWKWEKSWDFSGLCQYLLFVTFPLMANTNSHRS